MEIFFRLLFGHFLADFTFQTNFIARWKRDSFWGLVIHVLIHPVCYIALTWPFINDIWVSSPVALNGWWCIAIAAFLHFVEDWVRVTLVNRGVPDNTAFYFWDQAVHILILWFLCPTASQSVVSAWPQLGCLFVIVTHFATVTVWFIEKDIYGRDYPETEEKYVCILQRFAVWLAFFLPAPFWFVVAALLIVSFGRYVWTRRVDFSWTSISLGNVIAVACGAVSRYAIGLHF
jgi:hypothetical protein